MQLDVRQDIRSGGSPCSRIMEAADHLKEGDTLQLIAPFKPTPLYEVLRREGFTHEARELGDGDWEIQFTKTARADEPSPVSPSHKGNRECGCSSNSTEELVVDARGLEPPQPMVRILEALAALPDGAILRAFTDRQPMHLFEQLARRGFQGESREVCRGGYVTVIRQR